MSGKERQKKKISIQPRPLSQSLDGSHGLFRGTFFCGGSLKPVGPGSEAPPAPLQSSAACWETLPDTNRHRDSYLRVLEPRCKMHDRHNICFMTNTRRQKEELPLVRIVYSGCATFFIVSEWHHVTVSFSYQPP